jgi:hypothetical protein
MGTGRHPDPESMRYAGSVAAKTGLSSIASGHFRAYRDAYAAFNAGDHVGLASDWPYPSSTLDEYLAHMDRVIAMHEEDEAKRGGKCWPAPYVVEPEPM